MSKKKVTYREARKMLVNALKQAFPGVKFSVRKNPALNIIIRWDKGPTRDNVREVVSKFEGARAVGEYDTTDYYRFYDKDGAEIFWPINYIMLDPDPNGEFRDMPPQSFELPVKKGKTYYNL